MITSFESISSEDKVRIETTQDLIVGFLRLSHDIMSLHGEDKQTDAILAAGFIGAITELGKLAPNFLKTVSVLLIEQTLQDEFGQDAFDAFMERPVKYDA